MRETGGSGFGFGNNKHLGRTVPGPEEVAVERATLKPWEIAVAGPLALGKLEYRIAVPGILDGETGRECYLHLRPNFP